MITQTHRLDVVPGGVTTVVHVKQYQTDESLVFELFSRFGEFEISSAFTECTVRGTKSDGNGYSANATCDPSNSSVTVQLTEQMTAVAGLQPYELTVTDSTGRMITTTFFLDVQRAALDAGTVVSESVIREVQTIVEDYIEDNPGLFVVDSTLTQSGQAADAKVTGDEIADLQSAISGGVGIPAYVKEALLNCFENVAWINDDGQDYYDALEAALYPPVNLVSISAVYTQSGTVYDTDTLDSLKTDLVVTAHYDDSTTATVTTYTLSGTLTAGTSTVTVSYGGKTTTFSVTVTHDSKIFLHNWDFTDSLIDSVGQITAVLEGGVTQSAAGLSFTSNRQMATLGAIYARGVTYEIDIASMDPQWSEGAHCRFIMFGTAQNTGTGFLVYRKGSQWSLYSGNTWSSGFGLTERNAFNASTVKLVVDTDGYVSLYVNGTFIATSNITVPVASGQNIYIGNMDVVSNGADIHNTVITGFRVYEEA